MKPRWLPWWAAVIVVIGTGSVQGKKFIGSLRSVEGESLATKDGQVVLVRGQGYPPARLNTWHISAPQLRTLNGKLLALDQTLPGGKLYLAAEASEATKWVIEVSASTRPQHPKTGSRDAKGMLIGKSTTQFRLSVFGGARQGWYVAALEPRSEQSSAGAITWRPLTLVEDPKQALTFDYLDSEYWIR